MLKKIFKIHIFTQESVAEFSQKYDLRYRIGRHADAVELFEQNTIN